MKIQDLKQKNNKELIELLNKEKDILRDLRFQVLSDQHKKVTDIDKHKKNIARILTILNNKKNIDIKDEKVIKEEK